MRVAPNQAAVVLPPTVQSSLVTPQQAVGRVMRVEVLAQLDLLRYKLRTPLGERIAESRSALTIGDKLSLQVIGGDDKRLLVDKLPTPAQQANSQLKTFLPKQLDASRLMALLPALAAHAEAPEGVARLLAQLPTPAQLMHANSLQNTLKNSGLFFEQQLAAGIIPPHGDLKRQLLQLQNDLKRRLTPEASSSLNNGGSPHAAGKIDAIARASLPNTLLDILAQSLPNSLLHALSQELDGVLSRLVSHQLMHAGDEQKLQQHWLMELPVRDHDGIDLVQIQLSKDRRGAGKDTPQHALWKVSLSIALPDYGAIVATLAQQDECVHITFHAEQAHAHRWLSTHCSALRQRLQDCGLSVGHVQAQRGLPHDDTLPTSARGVLTERA